MEILEEVTKDDLKKHLTNIDLNDNILYDDMNNSSFGIFQFSGATAAPMLKHVKPRNFDELVAINAMARPGTSSFLGEYIMAKDGWKKYPEVIDELLQSSRGIVLFQEQIMNIVKKFSNGYESGANSYIDEKGDKESEEDVIVLNTEKGEILLLPYELVKTNKGIKQASKLTTDDILVD